MCLRWTGPRPDRYGTPPRTLEPIEPEAPSRPPWQVEPVPRTSRSARDLVSSCSFPPVAPPLPTGSLHALYGPGPEPSMTSRCIFVTKCTAVGPLECSGGRREPRQCLAGSRRGPQTSLDEAGRAQIPPKRVRVLRCAVAQRRRSPARGHTGHATGPGRNQRRAETHFPSARTALPAPFGYARPRRACLLTDRRLQAGRQRVRPVRFVQEAYRVPFLNGNLQVETVFLPIG